MGKHSFQRFFQKGSGAIFFYLFLFGGALAFYFSYYLTIQVFSMSQRLDLKSLEEAALFGARALPFRSIAADEARGYLKDIDFHNLKKVKVEVTEDGSSIIVTSARTMGIPLLGAFAPPEDREGLQLLARVSARARVIPRDVIIFLDNSKYLGPSLESTRYLGDLRNTGGYSRWRYVDGEDAENPWREATWEPSPYLGRIAKKVCSGKGCAEKNTKLIVTQHCHNPVFTAMKEGVYFMYDYLVSVGTNRVAVLGGPGPQGEIQVLRPFGHMTTHLGTSGEAPLDMRAYPESGLSQLDCLYASEEGYFGENTFREGLQYWMKGKWAEKKTLTWDDAPERLAGPNYRQYGYPSLAWTRDGYPELGVEGRLERKLYRELDDKDLRDRSRKDSLDIEEVHKFLTPRRSLWSRIINPTRIVEFPALINSVIRALPDPPEDNRITNIYLVLGEYPHAVVDGRLSSLYQNAPTIERDDSVAAQIRRSLQQLRSAARGRKIWLTFLLIRHDGMEQNCSELTEIGPQLDCQTHWERFADFEKFIERQEDSLEDIDLFILKMSDADTFAQEGSGLLPLAGKQIELF